MSKKEDKRNDKSKQGQQGNSSPESSGHKKSKLEVFKNKTVGAIAVVLCIIVAGLAIAYFVNTNSDEVVTEEQTQTYAENREQYTLEEGATQADHNSNNLSLAWDYYRELNYDRTLELLDLIQDPSENISASYNELYGLVLSVTGREDEAESYQQATLEAHEQFLIASTEEDPSAYYNLGLLYANAGQTDKAIESYRMFIVISEETPDEAVIYEGWDDELVELARQAIEELQ